MPNNAGLASTYQFIGVGERTLVGNRIVISPSLEELEELLRPPFLEQTHKWTGESLHLCAGNLGDPTIAVDEATRDLLELEISCNVGVHQNFGKLA